MVGHSPEDLAQAIVGDPKTQPLFKGLRGLLEHDDLQPVAHAPEVRPRPVRGQGALAEDEDIETREVRAGLDRLRFHAHRADEPNRFALRVENSDFPGDGRCGRARHHVDNHAIPLCPSAANWGLGRSDLASLQTLASAEADGNSQQVLPRRKISRQHAFQRNAIVFARLKVVRGAANALQRFAPHPAIFVRNCLSRVIDDNQLLLHRLTGIEIVILARERSRLAGEIGQELLVVPQDGLPIGGRDPIGVLVRHVHALVLPVDVIRAEPGALEIVPVHLEFLAALVHSFAQGPEEVVLPGGDRRDAPGAEGPPVRGQVRADDLVLGVEHG